MCFQANVTLIVVSECANYSAWLNGFDATPPATIWSNDEMLHLITESGV